MSNTNIDTIKAVYDAFGRGDVPAILDHLTDDVDWASEASSTVAPWHGVHKGKDQVPHFFEALASTVEVTRFEPLAFAANDTDVMVVIRFGIEVPSTGKSGEMDLHHWWRFEGGKIAYYRGTEDTALTNELLTA